MTNSAKAIFLSLMSCSINKLKPHMLYTCKNFIFSDFTWKKKFAPGNDGGGGGGFRPPSCPSFPYGPVLSFWIVKKSWPFLIANLIPNILKEHIRESNFVRTFYCEWNLKSFKHFPNYWKIHKILNFPLGKFSHRKIFIF